MLFYVRFRSQLRRTRPALLTALEDAVAQAVTAAGGRAETRRKILAASFDEDRIGFWLDMVIFLQRAHEALEKAAGELYGYVLTLGRDVPEAAALKMCCLPGSSHLEKGAGRGTGIWCSEEVRKFLDYYMAFEPDRAFCSTSLPEEDGDGTECAFSEEYRELLEWRPLGAEAQYLPCSGSAKIPGDTPPLNVRFGAGGSALICFADAFTPLIRSFLADAVSAETLQELDAMHAMLFGERLRRELSAYAANQVRRFAHSLFTAYIAAVKSRGARGALILEALHCADAAAFKVFKEVYFSLGKEKENLLLAAGNSADKSLKNWSNALNQVIINACDDIASPEKINHKQDIIPQEILEIAYNISLLKQYFPDYLFPQIFEEQGLGREMYFRALAMLLPTGMFGDGNSRSGMAVFASSGEKVLSARKEKIRGAVREIILTWVGSGKLRPCFNLLGILLELGGRADDALILRAIRADVLNGTTEGIVKSIKKGRFNSIVGDWNAPILTYIYKTLKALACEEKDAIEQVFQEPVPPMPLENSGQLYGGYQAQTHINLAAFYIGARNSDAASESVRKAMFLNRNLGKDAVSAHRLFSLVNLSRRRIDDALEYISYALDQAENNGQGADLPITCYFAASINFLYGNLSKARRLALRAEEIALAYGQPQWGMRSRFLHGKILFEIGQYGDALEIFESLDNAAACEAVPSPATMINTVRAWVYRTRVFLDRLPPDSNALWNGAKPPSFFDGHLFEIEAAYFSADYEKAKALAERFLASTGGDQSGSYSAGLYYGKHFLFTEQPDWRSGFAQCENMLFSAKAQETKMAWIYRTMSQCALRPSKEARAGILGGMQRFMRDELLSDTDPNDAFYFYAWYCMLKDTDAAQVDIHTAVSMAYKRLQRRAGRIDDIKTSQAFLALSRWNSTLRLAARECKLI